MALSQVSIVNMALDHLGTRSSIESLGENSVEARRASLWYPVALERALAVYDWTFARRRKALGLHGDAPPDQWGYRYIYPSDCVKFRRFWNPLGDSADPIPYTVETSNDGTVKTILTDLAEGIGIYTFLQNDPSTYTPGFADLLSLHLASSMYSLAGKQVTKNRLLQEIARAELKAPALDANEEMPKPEQDADWIKARA